MGISEHTVCTSSLPTYLPIMYCSVLSARILDPLRESPNPAEAPLELRTPAATRPPLFHVDVAVSSDSIPRCILDKGGDAGYGLQIVSNASRASVFGALWQRLSSVCSASSGQEDPSDFRIAKSGPKTARRQWK